MDPASNDYIKVGDVTVTVPVPIAPNQYYKEWARIQQLYEMDYAATMTGFESERRVAADDLLHKDDIKDISHNMITDSSDGHIILKTTLETFDNDTQTNKITSNDFDLTDAVNRVVGDRIDALEGGWIAKVGNDRNGIQSGDTLEFAVKEGEKNLTIDMNEDTIKFGFADNPEFESVKIDNTTINTTNNGDLSYTYNNITKTIATTDDGMKFGADNTTSDSSNVIDLELNQQLNIKGDGNIFTTADTNTNSIKVELSKKLTGLESISVTNKVEIGTGDTKITVESGNINNVTNIETESITLGSDNSTTNITFNDNRIVYVDDNNKEQQVATLNDGMRYGADNFEVELDLDLNDKLNIKGDNTNITTVATAATENTPAQIQVKLNNDITVNSVTANSVYSNYVEAKVVNAEKVLSDYVEANRINAGVVDADKVFSSYVETEIVNTDKIFSEYGEIKLVNSETVSAETLTLRGKTSNTDVIFNDVADGNAGAKGRIEYKDSSGDGQQVANLNDGLYYAGDTSTDEVETPYAKLNKTVKIYGGATEFTENDNIGVETTQNGDNVEMKVRLAEDIAGLNSVESNIVNVNNTLTVGDTNTNITVTKDTININNKTQITENGININNKVIVEENKVDVGGNRIENVADGVNPTDAVNVRQLDKLGNRVDKVGAGAAALAALHPLDFDPDDKLSFSAGVGNYGSETATALGAFYRPSEKVMLSAAGTMGNGENMVNLGVTFALDKTNNVSNSRVAMAREIQDLKSHIVKQDAQIAELIALVGQLTGKSIGQSEDSIMFPDVPENHWAYDYIEGLQKRGIVEGYPDGNFGGDRSMTRYEYAAMLYRALEKGFPVDSRLLDEFDAELGRIRIDRIKGLDDDDNKIERVRVNQYEDRDDYGSKLTAVNEAE